MIKRRPKHRQRRVRPKISNITGNVSLLYIKHSAMSLEGTEIN